MREHVRSGQQKERMQALMWQAPLWLMCTHLRSKLHLGAQHWNQVLPHHLLQRANHRKTLPPRVLPHYHLLQ